MPDARARSSAQAGKISQVSRPTNLEEAGILTAFLNQQLRAISDEVISRRAEAKMLVELAYCCGAGQ